MQAYMPMPNRTGVKGKGSVITTIAVEEDIRFIVESAGTARELSLHPRRLMGGAFIFVTGGSATITINIADYIVERNSFISLISDSIVQFTGKSGDFSAYYLVLSPAFLARTYLKQPLFPFFSSVNQHPVLLLEPAYSLLVHDYLSLFRKVYEREKHKTASLVARSLALSIMYLIDDVYKKERHVADSNQPSKKAALYKQLAGLILKYYHRERSIAFYAEKLCLTPKYLSAVILEESGKRVSDLISRAVIMDAKVQLKSTILTIQQISESLNFPDASLFGKYFKKHTGMTPGAYRNS